MRTAPQYNGSSYPARDAGGRVKRSPKAMAGASVQSFSLAARQPVGVIKLGEGMMRGLNDDPVQQVRVEALIDKPEKR